MKQFNTPKSLLLIAAIFSCCSFLFVNLHAGFTMPAAASTEMTPPQAPPAAVEDDQDRTDRDLPIPDVTVLGRLLELAQNLAGKG